MRLLRAHSSPGLRTQPISITHLSSKECQERLPPRSHLSPMLVAFSNSATPSPLTISHLQEISLKLQSRPSGWLAEECNKPILTHMVPVEAMMRSWQGVPLLTSVLSINSYQDLALTLCTGQRTRNYQSTRPLQSTSTMVSHLSFLPVRNTVRALLVIGPLRVLIFRE